MQQALGRAVGVTLVATVVACGCADRPRGDAAAEAPLTASAAEVQAWRDRHEEAYRRDWVSIAGLHFLSPGTHTVGSGETNDIVLSAGVPATTGRLSVADGTVRFEPEPDVQVIQGGRPLSGPVVLKEAGLPAADEILIGQVRLVIHTSGERLALRVRDPNGPPATAFLGFTWFPIDPAYRVTGRFIPDDEPGEISVVNTFGDLDTYQTDGVVEFELHGHTLRLRPFTTRPNRFFFVFRDASSGAETYAAARFLYADLRADGTTVLEFNQAYNPPCAFNPYTTCPIPLRENVLPIKILAGERAYPVEVTLPEQR
jgi:uncharacterized protein (DUF1684 family)